MNLFSWLADAHLPLTFHSSTPPPSFHSSSSLLLSQAFSLTLRSQLALVEDIYPSLSSHIRVKVVFEKLNACSATQSLIGNLKATDLMDELHKLSLACYSLETKLSE